MLENRNLVIFIEIEAVSRFVTRFNAGQNFATSQLISNFNHETADASVFFSSFILTHDSKGHFGLDFQQIIGSIRLKMKAHGIIVTSININIYPAIVIEKDLVAGVKVVAVFIYAHDKGW